MSRKSTLSASLTELSQTLFNNCSSLKSITIPSGVKKIGGGCFHTDCSSLVTMILPEGLETIEDGIGLCGFSEIVIPSTVTSFQGSTVLSENLQTITFKSNTIPTGMSASMIPQGATIIVKSASAQASFESVFSASNYNYVVDPTIA